MRATPKFGSLTAPRATMAQATGLRSMELVDQQLNKKETAADISPWN